MVSGRGGDGAAVPGYLLLQVLSMRGWRVSVVGVEDGVLVSAAKLGGRSVCLRGGSVAEVVVELVKQAVGA